MNKIGILLIFLFTLFNAKAQMVKVIDKTTQETIPGVLVFSNQNATKIISDQNGNVDLTNFKSSDSIYFKFNLYKVYGNVKSEILKKGSRIEMEIEVLGIKEVTVSANRWEQEQMEVPNKIKTISMKDALIQNPQTTADLLETSGYAFIQKSQMAGGSPMLRGFATNRVMIVVDGVRLNNAIFRSGNLQNVISLDANSLEGAEILFGPGAVMYGSDAIGGVMDFRTLQAQFSKNNQPYIKGSVFGRYSSANKENTFHFDYNYGTKKWAFLTSLTNSSYDDLMIGAHGDSAYLRPTYVQTVAGKDSMFVNENSRKQVQSGFSQYNIIQKIRFQASEKLEFNYGFNYSATTNAPRYDRLILDENGDGTLDFAQWYYGPQKWMMNQLSVKYKGKTKLFDQMRAIVAYQRFDESRHDRRFGKTPLRNQYEHVDAYSINIDFDKKINSRINLYYGYESVFNKVSSKSDLLDVATLESTPNDTRYPNGSIWQVHGVYANAKIYLNDKLLLSSGIRYNHYGIQAKFDTTFFSFPFSEAKSNNGALNGSLGLVYSPQKKIQIYTNFSTGFRAPNIDDIGKVFESEPGNVVVPNPNLKPEYAYSGEVGFAATIAKYVSVDGAAYYTLLTNALARRNFQLNGQDSIVYDGVMSQVQAIQNMTNAYVYGFQAGINVNLTHGFSLKSTISIQEGKEQSEDSLKYYPKPHVAPVFGRTALTYERRKFRLDMYALYNGAMNFEDLPLAEINDAAIYAKDENGNPYTPFWYTLNVKFALFLNKNIVFSGGIENLTDQLYRTYSSGITSPGRNYIISVKARF